MYTNHISRDCRSTGVTDGHDVRGLACMHERGDRTGNSIHCFRRVVVSRCMSPRATRAIPLGVSVAGSQQADGDDVLVILADMMRERVLVARVIEWSITVEDDHEIGMRA